MALEGAGLRLLAAVRFVPSFIFVTFYGTSQPLSLKISLLQSEMAKFLTSSLIFPFHVNIVRTKYDKNLGFLIVM